MIVFRTTLPGVRIVHQQFYGDERGFFEEFYNAETYSDVTGGAPIVQVNHSYSRQRTLRGLHYQEPTAQGKLVGVLLGGMIFDVAVDIRRGSPTFGKWYGKELGANQQMWIPPGFAHGFYTMSAEAHVFYGCTAPRREGEEYRIAWNDPALRITWPAYTAPTLSAKDDAAPCLSECDALPTYEDPCASS